MEKCMICVSENSLCVYKYSCLNIRTCSLSPALFHTQSINIVSKAFIQHCFDCRLVNERKLLHNDLKHSFPYVRGQSL